jgi:hypothetical protein
MSNTVLIITPFVQNAVPNGAAIQPRGARRAVLREQLALLSRSHLLNWEWRTSATARICE